jgi:ATP-dependent helicase/nuclease subunit A
VSNLLASPLHRELAGARQMFRELEFLLRWPAPERPATAFIQGAASTRGRFVTISGTIDCLMQTADGLWVIIDYKTGARGAADGEDLLLARYEIQLGLYALAAREILGGFPARVEVVFLRPRVKGIPLNPPGQRALKLAPRIDAAIAALLDPQALAGGAVTEMA